MKTRTFFSLLRALPAILLAGTLTLSGATPPKPIDLKPFLGKSQFQTIGADWMLPRGRQVVEGVPFQVDGVVEVAGSSARYSNVGRTNVNGIAVGTTFERLHLLAAASRDVVEGVVVAEIVLRYADGSQAEVSIEYGRHLSDWMGPRHKGEAPLIEPDARVAWQVEHPAAAKRDDHLRLFYMTLPNPSPEKEVRGLNLVGTRARGGLMVAAMTLSQGTPPREPDTLSKPAEHLHFESGVGAKPALSGRVFDHQGLPASNAVVRILSVKPLETGDVLLPEDSSVAGKETRSDVKGHYRLADLSERLLYRVMIASETSQAVMVDGADPVAGPLNVRMLPGPGAQQVGRYFVHARLVGPDNKPIVGASVKPDGVGTGTSTSWGANHGFPDEVVTGLSGEFVMSREQRFTRMSVDIKAPDLAPAKVWLNVSNDIQLIPLGVGVVLTGRVVKDGMPLPEMEVGVSGQNRSSEVYAGNFTVKTDEDGRFRFEHLPPETDWYLYGLMRSFRNEGSLTPRMVRSPKHGTSLDLGEIVVKPGIILAGQVVTKDGQALPSGLRVRVSYDSAWDNQTTRPDSDGYFELMGLHPGLNEISVEARGWSLSPENRSLDDWNTRSLIGRIDQDKRDLLIVIEKREAPPYGYASGNGRLPDEDLARNRPLFGAEESGPSPIVLAGTVVDDQSGAPVHNVRITPGRQPPTTPQVVPGGLIPTLLNAVRPRTVPWNERPFWEHARMATFRDGRFWIANRPLTSLPMLRVEAEGYEVLDTTPATTSDTNLVLRLKRGTGPAGTLLNPQGKPAIDAAIVFGSEQEQFSLSAEGVLSAYGQRRDLQKVAADGSFAFPSKAGGRLVFASSPEGWAAADVKNWPAEGRVHLEPWATVKGVLVDEAGRPLANVRLALQMTRNFLQNDPHVNIQERPETDSTGRFEFKKAPPGALQLSRLVPMSANSWTYALQTNFVAQPGKTNDLGRMVLLPFPARRPIAQP